jgi:hypothetical protein
MKITNRHIPPATITMTTPPPTAPLIIPIENPLSSPPSPVHIRVYYVIHVR